MYKNVYSWVYKQQIQWPRMAKNGQNIPNIATNWKIAKMAIYGSLNGQSEVKNTNSTYTGPERLKMTKKWLKHVKIPNIAKKWPTIDTIDMFVSPV